MYLISYIYVYIFMFYSVSFPLPRNLKYSKDKNNTDTIGRTHTMIKEHIKNIQYSSKR